MEEMGKHYPAETKTAVIEALRNGEDLAEVAGRFGVNRRTVMGWWRWQEKYELSPRHREFINQYFLKNMNGTRAYMAVYGVEPETAAVNASKLLRNTKVKAVVSDRLQRSAMSADEVQYRLAEQGRAEYAAYLTKDAAVDFGELIEAGKGHLVKTIKVTQYGKTIEFYDAQSALFTLAKIHGLTDNGASGREDDPVHVVFGWKDEHDNHPDATAS